MIRSVATLFFVGLFAVWAIADRFASVLFYWWFAIFRPQDFMWWNVDSWRLPLMAAAILIIPNLLVGNWPKLNNNLLVLMVLWVMLALLAFFLNSCGPEGQKWTEHMVKMMIVLLVTERLITSKQRWYWLLGIIAVSLAFYSGKGGFYALLSGGESLYDRKMLRGTFAGSNSFALGTAMILSFLVFMMQQSKIGLSWLKVPATLEKLKDRVFHLGVAFHVIFSAYIVIAFQSRGSALAMIAGIGLWVMLHKRRMTIISIAFPIALVGFAVVPLPDGYVERLQSAFASADARDNSARSRPHYWQVARNMVATNPAGVGMGCYKSFYNSYDISDGQFGQNRSVHSSHFQVLSEIGYAGFIVWILLFLVTYHKLWKIRRQALRNERESPHAKFYLDAANALICSQTVFILGGSFYEFAQNDITWVTFILTVALQKLAATDLAENSAKDRVADTVNKTPKVVPYP